MTQPGPASITDRPALARNRAQRRDGSADFLHHEARADLQDRLELVNRSFTRPAIVTGHRALWADFLPDARLIDDDDTLDLDRGAHDLVIHAMALHWANDPVGQIIQCRRALCPDGLFLACCPGGQTLSELRAVLAEAETATRGGLSPRVLPMADIRDLGALLQRAGLALPVADDFALATEYDSAYALMRDLRAMGEASALSARPKTFAPKALFERADALYRQHFPGRQKPVRATFDLMVLTGWAPAQTQQKPLRPGSATARLADALGTRETPLSD